ncbi:MAG: bacteriorhodopsin [Anaerolineales bacterium]|jgi:bacteriorhodopsin
MNLENLLTYSPIQWQLVAHILVLGFAAQAAGFVYFMTTMKELSPRYRTASILGSIVMVSAFMLLLAQSLNWQNTFVFSDGVFVRGESMFSNGFRYLNWLIDVPLLLLQLVIVLGLVGAAARRLGVLFVGSGAAMILLGYVGQFYETTNLSALWIWGGLSTVFYLVLLYLAWTEIGKKLPEMPASAVSMLKAIRWVFLIFWTFYPIAYIIPAILPTADGVVIRQITFTVADIVAKVIYGVMITKVAVDLSRAEGYLSSEAKAA